MTQLSDQDIRELLGRAAPLDSGLDPDRLWSQGRARRHRTHVAGVATAAAAALAALVVAVTAGVFGSGTPQPTTPATISGSITTFVFTRGPDGSQPPAGAQTRPATLDDLVGTAWKLADSTLSGGNSADLIGVSLDTTATFYSLSSRPENLLAISFPECTDVTRNQLQLDDQGRFGAGETGTRQMACAPQTQLAKDFWLAALRHPGTIQLTTGDAMLLTLDSVTATSTPTDPTPSATPTPTAPPTPTATDPQATAPPRLDDFVPPGTEVSGGGWPQSSAQLLATGVRTGRHDGFDRVVVDLSGTGSPAWHAAYVSDPVTDPSGQAAAVHGDQVLEVDLAGMAYPDAGSTNLGQLDTPVSGLSAVVDVLRTAPFEGRIQLFVGISGEARPFKIYTVSDPMRLVVDIATDPGASAAERPVSVYFGSPDAGNGSCSEVTAVTRMVPATGDLPLQTLQALLAGPTTAELTDGLTSWFSPLTADTVKSVTIDGDTAYVDFASIQAELIPNASTSCGSAAYTAQVEATLKRVAPVTTVIYSFDGQVNAWYEWMQTVPPTQ